MHTHAEILGTAIVIGGLVMAAIRLGIGVVIRRGEHPWVSFAITLCGITFAITRIVHLETSDPDVAFLMIRIQYGIGLLMPGLGFAAIEALSGKAVSRRTWTVIGIGLALQFVCIGTDAMVAGPIVQHVDLLGHPFFGAHVGWLGFVVLPVAIASAIFGIRRRLQTLAPVFGKQHIGFLIGAGLFALAGLHDSLAGAGVFRSVFLLEYVFVAFGVLSANFELRSVAFERGNLEALLLAKKQTLEEREMSLQRAHRRLERSNDRYRHLADATREGVILCSGFRVLDMNHAASKLLGANGTLVRPAEMRRADVRTLVVESDRERIEHVLGTDDAPVEMQFVRADATTVPVSVRSVVAPPGSKGTRVLVVRDVSTERELQRRLATADRLAAIGTLAAGTAHEINNPLAFVLANADLVDELIERHKLSNEVSVPAREMIADIRHGALRIRDVVRDLMSLAREKGGEVTNVDLNETLRRCIAMAAPQTRHRARVVSKLDELAAVHANEGRLFQVFLNLIVNAAQAIPEGATDRNAIRISGRNVGATVVIEISDTGSGIPPDVVDHIFEPFFTTKAIGQGTGLGLSISQGIVTDLGGHIEVDSKVGVGTTFRVVLPANGVFESTAPIRVAAPATPRLRVLIVDDEQRIANSLAKMLDAHDVDVAHSGRAALQRIASHRYDVALCDVMMPDVTGIQLYQQLCAARDPITDRFLFMTGGVASPEAQQFLEQLGAKRWVPKPIPMAELRRLVSELGARPL
ncbi:MAG: ATP-binding protein [Kofleriaceae bacterium]